MNNLSMIFGDNYYYKINIYGKIQTLALNDDKKYMCNKYFFKSHDKKFELEIKETYNYLNNRLMDSNISFNNVSSFTFPEADSTLYFKCSEIEVLKYLGQLNQFNNQVKLPPDILLDIDILFDDIDNVLITNFLIIDFDSKDLLENKKYFRKCTKDEFFVINKEA